MKQQAYKWTNDTLEQCFQIQMLPSIHIILYLLQTTSQENTKYINFRFSTI